MNKKSKSTPYLFLLPALLLSIIFIYYPFIKTIILSISQVNQQGEIMAFTGLENYIYLFSYEPFRMALKNTITLTFLFVPLSLILATLLACIANKKRKASVIYETLFLTPMAVSMPVASLVFKVLLSPVGIINTFFNSKFPWFTESKTALFSVLLVCLWMGFSFDYLLLLHALRSIPNERIEAAMLDGANQYKKFFYIQIPEIMPTIKYVVFTNLVQMMMISGPIMIITQGGPRRSTTSLIYLMYISGYESSNYGLASAIAVVTFMITFILSGVVMFTTVRQSNQQKKRVSNRRQNND